MITPIFSGVAGVVGAAFFIHTARREGPATEVRWYAGGLVVAAGVYVAFGLVLGGPPLGWELLQLGAFLGAAVFGLKRSSVVLAAGWLLHSGWDALHALPGLSQHAPEWYVVACLAFDVPLAAYIFRRRRSFVPTEAPAPPIVNPLQ